MSLTARADVPVLQALVQLQGHPDFQRFQTFITLQHEAEARQLRLITDGSIALKQGGREAVLFELVQLLHDPRTALDAAEQRLVPRNEGGFGEQF